MVIFVYVEFQSEIRRQRNPADDRHSFARLSLHRPAAPTAEEPAHLVQDLVGGHHVVHNVALGDLLAAERLGGLQVLAVVVAEVVVAGNALGQR